ncbi:MAG TPA: hypothetical protein VLK85_30505 [Ramlibacter sp.]|nr:hypothetical protein [Ramlibacter sp.]
MAKPPKVIITCAVTGAIHTPIGHEIATPTEARQLLALKGAVATAF